MVKLTRFDAADYIRSWRDAAALVWVAIKDRDVGFLKRSLAAIVRAALRGIRG